MLPGRTENSIKNFFYSTVRKNLRRVNKRMILEKKIEGSIIELSKDPVISELIFCNAKKCLKMAEKLKRERNFASSESIERQGDETQMENRGVDSSQNLHIMENMEKFTTSDEFGNFNAIQEIQMIQAEQMRFFYGGFGFPFMYGAQF